MVPKDTEPVVLQGSGATKSLSLLDPNRFLRPLSPLGSGQRLNSPSIKPFHLDPSINSSMTLINSRQIALLQSRLDHHEVELHELHRRVELQKTLISKLLQMMMGMRDRNAFAERLADKMLKLLRALSFQMNVIKVHLSETASSRGGILKLAAGQVWKLKGWATKMTIVIGVCHMLLRVTQAYYIPETILGLLVGGLVPPAIKRRAQQAGNMGLLLLTVWIWRDLISGKTTPGFPLNLLF